MISQIYGISNLEDAIGCMNAGADHIGILPPSENGETLPGMMAEEECFAILNALRGKCKVIMLSESDDPNVYIHFAEKYHPDIIQVAAKTFASNEEFYHTIKSIDPNVDIMQCVPVGSDVEAAVKLALEREKYADWLITDTFREGGAVGASGVTHSQEADIQIVKQTSIPVILAGGLGCDNAEQVAKAVKPAGLDTLTKTNIPHTFRKDLELVRKFSEIVHQF